MDLDVLCTRYFGTTELETLDDAALKAGSEQLAIDFAVETEPSRRFALWALMAGLDIAPSPADAFPKDEKLRSAANVYRHAVEADAGRVIGHSEFSRSLMAETGQKFVHPIGTSSLLLRS